MDLLKNSRISHYFFAMLIIVALSNYIVQFPINDWLTWAAFSYPISFLITELTNRFHGPKAARRIVYAGFATGTLISIWLSTPKIAIASGSAFLVSQLLDIFLFNRLRYAVWWCAPLVASGLASIVDTALFWTIAFWGENLPILTWGLGDLCIKLFMDLLMLTPFRQAIQRIPQPLAFDT